MQSPGIAPLVLVSNYRDLGSFADRAPGASIPGGIFGILLGAAFLIAAWLHLKRQIQGGFRLEEIPAEIIPEMRQATDAICGF